MKKCAGTHTDFVNFKNNLTLVLFHLNFDVKHIFSRSTATDNTGQIDPPAFPLSPPHLGWCCLHLLAPSEWCCWASSFWECCFPLLLSGGAVPPSFLGWCCLSSAPLRCCFFVKEHHPKREEGEEAEQNHGREGRKQHHPKGRGRTNTPLPFHLFTFFTFFTFSLFHVSPFQLFTFFTSLPC